VYPSAVIAGSGDALYLHIEFTAQNVRNIEDHTKLSTIEIWLGVARQILKSILLDWKLK